MTDFDPATLAHTLFEHGRDWADKNASADILEETRRTLHSQIAVGLLPECKSVAKAEMHAEATEEYIEHIKAMVEARKAANTARVQYDADRAFIDLLRSQESSRRTEMQLGGR